MKRACSLILLIRSSSARSGEPSIPASSTVPFRLRDTLATFSARQFSPLVISVWSLPVSSNSHLLRTILLADWTTAQPTRSRLLWASSPQRRRFSFPRPSLPASCPKSHPSRTCSRSLLHSETRWCMLWATCELLCVVARRHPGWSLRAALVQSRSHAHLPSILWIHVVCSDCSALLHTAQIPAETVVA